MQVRYAGDVNSLFRSGEVMPIGAAVVLDSAQKWVKSGDDVKPLGLSLQHVRQISTGFNIYNSSYDKGESSVYDGRRNKETVTYANVGDPIGVVGTSESVIDHCENYTGNLSVGDKLCSAANGVLKVTATATLQFAVVLKAGNSANGDKITIQIL